MSVKVATTKTELHKAVSEYFFFPPEAQIPDGPFAKLVFERFCKTVYSETQLDLKAFMFMDYKVDSKRDLMWCSFKHSDHRDYIHIIVKITDFVIKPYPELVIIIPVVPDMPFQTGGYWSEKEKLEDKRGFRYETLNVHELVQLYQAQGWVFDEEKGGRVKGNLIVFFRHVDARAKEWATITEELPNADS